MCWLAGLFSIRQLPYPSSLWQRQLHLRGCENVRARHWYALSVSLSLPLPLPLSPSVCVCACVRACMRVCVWPSLRPLPLCLGLPLCLPLCLCLCVRALWLGTADGCPLSSTPKLPA
eukprot:COSAG03_NODE_180_length_11014_cov_43.655428_2_plen_117_part_00